MTMQKKSCEICFATPAFLGDASQSGVWRTPPFKALLREWWRVAAGRDNDYDHRRLREREGELFGNAWLEPVNGKSRFQKSKVRLALKHWNAGKGQHAPQPAVRHPEVQKTNFQVEPLNYLGYGPIDRGQYKHGASLQANDTNTLALAWPETETSIPHTLQLMDWFGTVGGRSRNGWGSLALGLEPLAKNHPQLDAVLRDLRECLHLDWPHAIGKDANGPLIWESRESFADWKAAMTFLARTKIGFRTSLTFENGQPHPNERKRQQGWQLHHQPEGRHLLAYPVTHHEVSEQRRNSDQPDWGGDGRLANQLRFKLFRDTDKQLRARIYHTPHKCPLPMNNLDQLAVWQTIHRWLDEPQTRQADYQQLNIKRLGVQP